MERLTTDAIISRLCDAADNRQLSYKIVNTIAASLKYFDEFTTLMEQYNIPDLPTLETLLKANAEGRVVMLPGDVGSDVYCHSWRPTGTPVVIHDLIMGYEVNKDDLLFVLTGGRTYRSERFGKSIFLTRQEAEVALEKEKTNE